MTVEDLVYEHDIRRHRTVGRALALAGMAAEFGLIWIAGMAMLVSGVIVIGTVIGGAS